MVSWILAPSSKGFFSPQVDRRELDAVSAPFMLSQSFDLHPQLPNCPPVPTIETFSAHRSVKFDLPEPQAYRFEQCGNFGK